MRAPAPPYPGEGVHALWHVSEDGSSRRFEPHRSPTSLRDELLVWTIDARHAEAEIELRVLPNLWPLWNRGIVSTLEFSRMRLRNAAPPP